MERYCKTILSALGLIENWAKSDQNALWEAQNTLRELHNKNEITLEEHLKLIDEKLNLVGAATLHNDKSIFAVLDSLEKEIRTMKRRLSIMRVVLVIAVIAIILLAIF